MGFRSAALDFVVIKVVMKLEPIPPFAIICLANGVRTKVAGSVAVASTPLPATVRSAIVVSRIAATVRAKKRLLNQIRYKKLDSVQSNNILKKQL